MTPEWAVGLVAPFLVGSLIWVVRLEGRVNTHDQQFGQLTKSLDHLDAKLDDIMAVLVNQSLRREPPPQRPL